MAIETPTRQRAQLHKTESEHDAFRNAKTRAIQPHRPQLARTATCLLYTSNTTVVADPAAVDPDTLLTLRNDAKMAWSEASYGNGPGTLEGSTPTLSVKKDVTDEYSLLAKTVGIYDEPNHEIPWGIKLNLAGADLGNTTQASTEMCIRDSGIPVPLSAEVSTMGHPSFRESWATSILSPFFLTKSIMLSAITTGSPRSSTCVVRYRLRSRFVASTRLITTSGRPSSR